MYSLEKMNYDLGGIRLNFLLRTFLAPLCALMALTVWNVHRHLQFIQVFGAFDQHDFVHDFWSITWVG